MDFRTEFFPLLNEVLYKDKSGVPKHIISNSDMYLMQRYISFYDPHIVKLIDQTLNKALVKFSGPESGKYLYEYTDSIIPKLNRSYIKYVSKPKMKVGSDADDFVHRYALKYNMSEREVWGMIYLLNELN